MGKAIAASAAVAVLVLGVVGVILDCIRGDHDQFGGGVLYVPGPGVMTLDRDRAMEVLAAIWAE